MTGRVILALDVSTVYDAALLVERTIPFIDTFKVGSQLFTAVGPTGVLALALPSTMLDLKWHDIPETVARSVRASLPLKPHSVTVHASGGPAMITAARSASEEAGTSRPLILAITVLTSLDLSALVQLGLLSELDLLHLQPNRLVMRLAQNAVDAGADGLVCSPLEVAGLRARFGSRVILKTPGVRSDVSVRDSHARTGSATAALRAGSDRVIVGRPIYEAPDPRAAAKALVKELRDAFMPVIGSRWRLLHDETPSSDCFIPAGIIGTVTRIDGDLISIKLDTTVAGLEDDCLQVSPVDQEEHFFNMSSFAQI